MRLRGCASSIILFHSFFIFVFVFIMFFISTNEHWVCYCLNIINYIVKIFI